MRRPERLVEPTQEDQPQEIAPVDGRPGRVRSWADRLEAERHRLVDRGEAERRRHRPVDALYDMAARDADVGGGIIAGALAYRLFIWLLPLALVAVAGLGFATEASSGTPQEAAESLGLEGLVSSSVASAARSANRWYALLIGIPVLVWATRGMLRVLIGAHRLVWLDVRQTAPKPTLVRTLELLGLVLGFWIVSLLAGGFREWSPGTGVVATLVAVLPYVALWLLISLQLPHRDAPWTALLPGALLYGVGTEVLSVVAAYVITPWALAKQGTYGALGIAAALLFGLYLISRLIVGAAILNATLWERRTR
jgi:uncharacterized BrkB/YihY/UPF0761 family membrane protein